MILLCPGSGCIEVRHDGTLDAAVRVYGTASGAAAPYLTLSIVRGTDADDSLAIARTVSAAVTSLVRAVLPGRPAWVVAKGGITSHDVAVAGLGIRRARVLGQLLTGMVSVLRPLEAADGAVGIPYVVFAGNVGDTGTLAHVVDVVAGPATDTGTPAPARAGRDDEGTGA